MPEPEPPTGPAPENPPCPSDLTGPIRELSLRLTSLDARSAARQIELEAKLDTALRALELIHDDDPRARRELQRLRASDTYD